MPAKKSHTEVPVEKLRWRLDLATLPFETTDDLKPLQEIIGQKRGVEAFHFGMGMNKQGYNVFVTGVAGTGRMATVQKLIKEISKKGSAPDDLCYMNNFENPEAPLLLRLKTGTGSVFKKSVNDLVETLKKKIPKLFESQEYINLKKEIMQTYEDKAKGFFKGLVTTHRYVIFNVGGVNHAIATENDSLLEFVKRDFMFVGDFLLGGGVLKD